MYKNDNALELNYAERTFFLWSDEFVNVLNMIA